MKRTQVLSAAGAVLAGVFWWRRRHPAPLPYGMRGILDVPRPLITRRLLLEVLDPRDGERVLEVGPGTGHYSLPVAERLGKDGRLDVLDIQPQMLEHTKARAVQHGLGNLVPARGMAHALPYADGTFDAAYLVTVLGEVPDKRTAIKELYRVLRPGGRLVDGEIIADWDWVRPAALRQYAEDAGLIVEGRWGPAIGYFSRFRRPEETPDEAPEGP